MWLSFSTHHYGDITEGEYVIHNVTDPDELRAGQALAGTGIPASARVVSVHGSTVVFAALSPLRCTCVQADIRGDGSTEVSSGALFSRFLDESCCVLV
jgi:hypothetical protein